MRPLRYVLLLLAALGTLYAASGPAEPAPGFTCPVAGAGLADEPGDAGIDHAAPVRLLSALAADDHPPKPKPPGLSSAAQRPRAARGGLRPRPDAEPGLSRQAIYLVTRRLRV